MASFGRPSLGPQIKVRLGDTLPGVEAYQRGHGITDQSAAIRRLVDLGLSAIGSRRVPTSTVDQCMHKFGTDESESYLKAVDDGDVLRESDTPGDDPHYLRVVRYTDPVDGAERYAVIEMTAVECDLRDFVTQAEAEDDYEEQARNAAECGNSYEFTDVDGVPVTVVDTDDDD